MRISDWSSDVCSSDLLLSAVAQWAITPLLMIGGAYLCFEGAEKVLHSLQKNKTTLAEDVAVVADQDHEESMVTGAVSTEFILSAANLLIALNVDIVRESCRERVCKYW